MANSGHLWLSFTAEQFLSIKIKTFLWCPTGINTRSPSLHIIRQQGIYYYKADPQLFLLNSILTCLTDPLPQQYRDLNEAESLQTEQ